MSAADRDATGTPPHDLRSVTEAVAGLVERRGVGKLWVADALLASALFLVLAISITWLFVEGVGIWGVDVPVGWGFAITNFVWWIGIGHAGTLISAILLLMRQRWRRSINRFAEAMTLFAIAAAGLFPLLHLGRPQLFYWLFPYPSTMGVWPQWRSSLVWDVFAVMTYAIVSVLFWFVGIVPDLATMRDRARQRWKRWVLGALAMGWRGSARHWSRYRMAYLLLAGLATPLVVSVHSVVSTDFAIGLVPGWHSTLAPPFFVAGAIYSGLAMVFLIAVPLRHAFGLHAFVTDDHLDAMAKLTLATGWMVTYGYAMEFWLGWYGGEAAELGMLRDRLVGAYAPLFYLQIFCNCVLPQALWSRRVRRSGIGVCLIGLAVLVGMWIERFMIVVQSLQRDFLPSSWGTFVPTVWDWATLLGSVGLFALLMLLFVRLLPSMSMHELREDVPSTPSEPADRTVESEPGQRPDAPPLDEATRWGLLAEFETREALVDAARRVHELGYEKVDAYSPTPVDELDDALGLDPRRLARWTLIGGIVGALAAWGLQVWTSVVDYPLNVGGKPTYSWPAFVPVAFEMAVLGAALATLAGLLIGTRLPEPYHPTFHVPGFERASQDRFFLGIRAEDPRFDAADTSALLASCGPLRVAEVPR